MLYYAVITLLLHYLAGRDALGARCNYIGEGSATINHFDKFVLSRFWEYFQ